MRDVIEEQQQFVDGQEIPPDTSKPNPNGEEFDNLYLVSTSPATCLPSLHCCNVHVLCCMHSRPANASRVLASDCIM